MLKARQSKKHQITLKREKLALAMAYTGYFVLEKVKDRKNKKNVLKKEQEIGRVFAVFPTPLFCLYSLVGL